ncbi:SNF2-related protein [Ferrimonas balearica DSM 9799]|uniref:SNF2-related protein n=1 Tax=Ferrimonas balearica (strain DSM 9799 / CCM 4581 / KCTC 23876 / PAT) TaxID=550540 RepID=E1SVZ2_FERBD|nr:protein DpdE [Ferrimonas balearica]ADN77443.1 SNF2-related protein [Ferrimonas balearica DSM 9799]
MEVTVTLDDLVYSNNGLGIGKAIDVNAGTVTIGYFDSPMSPDAHRVTMALSDVKAVNLNQEELVHYFNAETNQWEVGRVVGPAPAPADYRIQFPNDVLRDLAQAEIYVRWDKPIQDAVEWLANQQTYTPFFQDSRMAFQNHMLEQREACAGVTAALSSSIALEPHQLAVVRRVLSDPIQRYLLADEVGLGKTIEAGLILRQHVLENPQQHQVLILVPEVLLAQWHAELTERFHLAELMDISIRIRSFEQFAADDIELDQANLVVIDEAHQVGEWAWSTRSSPRYQALAELVHASDKLLLLSATPLVGNERNFLAMLHLLDPQSYQLTEDGVVEFRQRIEIREQLGGIIQSFRTSNGNLQLRNSLNKLLQTFPMDDHLQVLGKALLPYLAANLFSKERPEEANQLVQQVRHHIANRHGVHHRLLRNRRSMPQVGNLLPGLAGLERRYYQGAGVGESLSAWRDHMMLTDAHSTRFASVYRLFVEASLGAPLVLAELASARLEQRRLNPDGFILSPQQCQDLCGPLVPGEGEWLRELIERARNEQSGYQRQLNSLLGQLLRESALGVVIFCDHPWSADQLFSDIGLNYSGQIQRHNPSQTLRFGQDTKCRVLICDRRAEEGINLHGSHRVAIHYDVLFSPNRMEQRNGRLNRYFADHHAMAVRNFVILSNDEQSLANHWINILDRSFEVFDRSIAGLQFVIDDQMSQVDNCLYLDGLDALLALNERLVGEQKVLETELDRIRNLEALMSVDADVIEAGNFVRKLQQIDELELEFEQAASCWINKQLGFVVNQAESPGVIRYRFNHGGAARGTMVSLKMLIRHCLLGFDFEHGHCDAPVTYEMSYRRASAQNRHQRVARLGEPFHDAMSSMLSYELRGMASAMVRKISVLGNDDMPVFFRLDYLVSACIDENSENVGALRRLADRLMPPKQCTVWLNQKGERIINPAILKILEPQYVSYEKGGSDINLAKRWSAIEALFSKAQWKDVCQGVGEQAEHLVAAEYQTTHQQGMDNLANYLASGAQLPETYRAGLRKAFERPNYKCLASRAVFLASPDVCNAIKNI